MDDGDAPKHDFANYLVPQFECEYLLVSRNNSIVGDIQDHQAVNQMNDWEEVGAIVCEL